MPYTKDQHDVLLSGEGVVFALKRLLFDVTDSDMELRLDEVATLTTAAPRLVNELFKMGIVEHGDVEDVFRAANETAHKAGFANAFPSMEALNAPVR